MARKRTPEELPQPKNNMWDLIAWYLRSLRLQKGLSGEAVGQILSISKAKVSRIEIGKDRLDWKQARALDKAWGTCGIFGLLVWYASIGHDPQWFAQYMELEQRAETAKIYEGNVIPALFQTEDYARALLQAGIEPDLEMVLMERLQRQNVLTRNPPPHLMVIISQNAIEWPVGNPEIMRAQLARVLEVAEWPNALIRVVPRSWDVGAHAGLGGSFQLLTGGDFGEVAFTASPGAGRLVSSPSEVRSYDVRYEHISAKALMEGPSLDLVRKVMEAFT
ncbi:helix-turn-helix domain-containing protein [Actinomadura terrae]|uniref:helix-turn-helix domain-containing protein n=1 Tax=Actinomadura terrae TaxID=604353 RepID=UPI001FA76808|nr:helix-turn-helix transcriptional regulator [Actinomadura terrae]